MRTPVQTAKKNTSQSLVSLALWGIAICVYIVPFYYVIVNSLKTVEESTVLSLSLPTKIVLSNFYIAFTEGDMLKGLINSLIIVVAAVVMIITCSALAAFYIQRSRSKWADFLFYLFISGMALPISVVTTFALLQKIHLLNTLLGVSFIYSAMRIPFVIFIYVGFLKTIPKELDEAAIIDGCSQVGMFTKIILPLLKPVTITGLIVSVQFIWNNFDVILFFIQSYSKFTLPLSIYNFAGMYHTEWNLIFAGSIITVIPVLIIYVFGQRYILSGLTSGAVKG